MNVDGVRNGIVIDHIRAGRSMEIYHYLHLDAIKSCVAIIQNVDSEKYGKKDIIKIDGKVDFDFDVLGVLDPNITINIIKNGVIVEKRKLNLPENVTNIIHCKNPRCITSIEQELPHRFKLTDRAKGIYRCVYCEQKFSRDNGR